jgi:hypothetical protein
MADDFSVGVEEEYQLVDQRSGTSGADIDAAPNTPSNETTASSAGTIDNTAYYVRPAARSVHSSRRNSAHAFLNAYVHDRPDRSAGESDLRSSFGGTARSFSATTL